MTRTAILCEDSRSWELDTWEQTLPHLLRTDLKVCGFWSCPHRLANLKPNQIGPWYLKTFGIGTVAKLAAYAGFVHVGGWFRALAKGRKWSFDALCRAYDIEHRQCRSANDPVFIEWLHAQEIDILIIMVGHILGPDVIAAPRLGTINKHASVLPSHKGLFPYFWVHLAGDTQGISFHTVEKNIDAGRLLFQARLDNYEFHSMVDFYRYVFGNYPQMLIEAIDALREERYLPLPKGVEPSYHGLPDHHAAQRFFTGGGNIIDWRDLLSAFHPLTRR